VAASSLYRWLFSPTGSLIRSKHTNPPFGYSRSLSSRRSRRSNSAKLFSHQVSFSAHSHSLGLKKPSSLLGAIQLDLSMRAGSCGSMARDGYRARRKFDAFRQFARSEDGFTCQPAILNTRLQAPVFPNFVGDMVGAISSKQLRYQVESQVFTPQFAMY
jgi:hypothetical protein